MADGVGDVRAAVLFPCILVAVIWMCLPEAISAQPTTTSTPNMSNGSAPVCNTGCCESMGLMTEARLACQEFRSWGIKDELCYVWQLNIQDACMKSCSNCTEISKAIFDQCLFFLQSSMEFTQALSYCGSVEMDFLNNGRCESACNTTVAECRSQQALECMTKCGNYQECGCWQFRGTGGEPTVCEGETLMKKKGYSFPNDPTKKTFCTKDMNESCYNHVPGTQCGKYKWCEADFCYIKGILDAEDSSKGCPITDSCQIADKWECEKSEGKCYYEYWEDGTPCTDGVFYTRDDVCINQRCTGWTDRCLQYAVECSSSNDCLVNGTCHQVSGACLWDHRHDGTVCTSQPGMSSDGTCVIGICQRDQVDPCAGKSCESTAGSCFEEATCNKLTGQCNVDPVNEGTKCTDNDTETYLDMCIEGACIGDPYPDPMYRKAGDGFCADSKGELLQRYFADTFDMEECEKQCSDDPGCIGYSFGFHSCSIHGVPRTAHPSEAKWGMLWLLGVKQGDNSSVAAKITGVTPPKENQQVVTCMQKVEYVPPVVVETPILYEVVFGCLIALLACSPAIWIVLHKLRQHKEPVEGEEPPEGFCTRCCKRFCQCKCCRRKQGPTAVAQPLKLKEMKGKDDPAAAATDGKPALSPRDGNPSAVAAAPAIPDAGDDDPDAPAGSAVPIQEDPSADVVQVVAEEVRDPRGEVGGEEEKKEEAPATVEAEKVEKEAVA